MTTHSAQASSKQKPQGGILPSISRRSRRGIMSISYYTTYMCTRTLKHKTHTHTCIRHRHISGRRHHAAHGLQYNVRLFLQEHTNTKAHNSLACLCHRHISGCCHHAAHGLQYNVRLFPQEHTNTQAHDSLACLCHRHISGCRHHAAHVYTMSDCSRKNKQTHKHITHSHASAISGCRHHAAHAYTTNSTFPAKTYKHTST